MVRLRGRCRRQTMVTDDQLSTLVYQLRDRLKPHDTLIRTVPRFGYMLDLPG